MRTGKREQRGDAPRRSRSTKTAQADKTRAVGEDISCSNFHSKLDRPYIDQQGRRYGSAVMNWSEAARRALGIRLAGEAMEGDDASPR